MKNLMFVGAIVLVLLCVSTASASWTYVVPARGAVVYGYWPGAPAYAYPPPAVVAAPVYAPAPAAYPVPGAYAAPVVVFPKVYVYGQPVRNALRAVTP